MLINDVSYSSDIADMILVNLDGWVIKDPIVKDDTDNKTGGVSPFMTDDEMKHKANKVITSTECQLIYEETLDMAYMHCNRLNIEDLNDIEKRAFIRAVCKWTASNLWNKYNVRVNNEDMEDVYVQSYGGLLYKSALKSLQPFINQHVTGMFNINESDDTDDDIWVV